MHCNVWHLGELTQTFHVDPNRHDAYFKSQLPFFVKKDLWDSLMCLECFGNRFSLHGNAEGNKEA